MERYIIRCIHPGCHAKVFAGSMSATTSLARRAGWAYCQQFAWAKRHAKCPLHRKRKLLVERHVEVVQALIDQLDGDNPLNMSAIAKRIGLTRERVRQLVRETEDRGLFPGWSYGVMRCVKCGTEHRLKSAGRQRSAELLAAGWEVRSYPQGYRCPDCLKTRSINVSWREDWPNPDTTAGRVLAWMESGKPYSVNLIADSIGAHPNKVSLAKRQLYNRGKWKWPLYRHDQRGIKFNAEKTDV